MDIVFKNGAGIRFRFAFQFEFEFLPGFLGDDGLDSYLAIQDSNIHFAYATSNAHAIQNWNWLTASMYDFNLYYDTKYRSQCKSYTPVYVSANVMEWEHKTWQQLLVQVTFNEIVFKGAKSTRKVQKFR